MKYKVGVGLLIEDDAFNKIRHVQMDIAETIDSTKGLTQPPHVTVVRPFTVESHVAVQRLIEVLTIAGDNIEAKDISFDDFASFDTSTLYLKPDNTEFFKSVCNEIERRIQGKPEVSQGNTDDRELIFHSTISYSLTSTQFKKGLDRLDTHEQLLPIETTISKIGLFLEVEGQWIVVGTVTLKA